MAVGMGSKWRDQFYIKIYILACAGQPEDTIAKALGVDKKTFHRWKESRPAIEYALMMAQKKFGKDNTSFRQYVYDRLPDDLKHLWDEINECEKAPNPTMRLESLLADRGKLVRQHLFLYALVHFNFNASAACRHLNITRDCLSNWIDHDPNFARLLDEMHWHKKNLYEEGLIRLVKGGDSAATIFAAKTQLRDRGYAEKLTVEHEHSGHVEHKHTFDITDLNLSLECRKELLNAIREHKKRQEAEGNQQIEGQVSKEPKRVAQVEPDGSYSLRA